MFKTAPNGDSKSDGLSPYLVAFIFLLISIVCYALSEPAILNSRTDNDAQDLIPQVKVEVQKGNDVQLNDLLIAYTAQHDRKTFLRGAIRHVSLAFFVAGLLILFVDSQAKRTARQDLKRHLKQVTENVFVGVADRLIGGETTNEIASVLREDFAKENCGFQITLSSTPEGETSDRVVTLIENWYSIRNLGGRRIIYPFEVDIRGYAPGKARIGGQEVSLPEFTRIKINQQEIPLKDIVTPETPFRIEREVPLPEDPNTRVEIFFALRLLCRTRHTEVFYSDHVVEKSSMNVINQVPTIVGRCTASVLHPAHKEVRNPAKNRWEFQRSLLPGQGWYVEWEPAEVPDTKPPVNKDVPSGQAT